MSINLDKIKAKAEAQSRDMTQAQAGGVVYEAPAAGPCRVRFVGYIELGKHKRSFQGKEKITERVRLIFEVSGPKHPPRDIDGQKVPHLIVVDENLSLNEKAHFFKLFSTMNWKGTAKHMASLLGEPFLGEVVHRKWKKKTDTGTDPASWTGLDVSLFKRGVGYTLSKPFRANEDDELIEVKVAEAISPLRFFTWDGVDTENWDSIYIDGEYPARTNDKGEVTIPAKSKNVHQLTIRKAENFSGSEVESFLKQQGITLELVGDDEEAPAEDQPASTPEPRTVHTDADDSAVNALLGG